MRYTQKSTHEYIMGRIKSGQSVNRSDLIDVFGYNVVTASRYIQSFMKAHPGVMHYDASAKMYVAL